MTGTIGTVGGTTSVNTTHASAASNSASSSSFSVDTQKAVTTQAQTADLAPRIVVDPVVGVITQFLDGQGNVASQLPSKIIVAYLKAGLTQDGFGRPIPSPSGQDQDNTISA